MVGIRRSIFTANTAKEVEENLHTKIIYLTEVDYKINILHFMKLK